jgi:hypothetical protein
VSISKNFVIKHGLEVSTDLILANADTRRVGIASTNPQFTLDVAGGIGATNFYLTGIGTFVDKLNVGLGGTVLTVLGIGNSIGIGTALPQYLLDIRSPVSSGQTALYIQGDIRITGDIEADDVQIQNIIVTGLSTFNSNVFIGAALNVSGITTLGGYVDINDSVDISNDLNVVGITTLATADINAGEIDVTRIETGDLNVSGISSLGTVEINAGIITASSGIVTYFGDGSGLINTPPGSPAGSINQVQYNDGVSFAGSPNFTFDGNNVNVVGIITALEFYGDGSNLTGIATGGGDVILGITTITELNVTGITTLTSLEVTGISTFGNIVLDPVGIITAVSGIVTYYGDGSNLIGIDATALKDINGNTIVQASADGVVVAGNANISGVVTASAFFGDGSGLTGTGSTVFNDAATNQEFFPLFTDITSGTITASGISTSKLTYNPSTGTLTSTAFVGDGSGLTGTGSTVFNDTTTDQEFFPLFTDITTGTIIASGISTSKLTYNPSTGTLTAVDINSTSDINLKENIKTIENSLNTLTQLRGVSFDWKETGKSSYGVIAQELQEVLPELVKNGEVKSVNYNGLIGVLIEGMKSQQEQINRLEQKIQELTK